jgi:hypothetical protein
VRVATGDHASQSPIMFVEGALELFKDFIQFGRLGSCDRLGAKLFNPVFQSGRHCRAELPEENPIRTRMVRYSTSSRKSSPLDVLVGDERRSFGPCGAISRSAVGAENDGLHIWQVHTVCDPSGA